MFDGRDDEMPASGLIITLKRLGRAADGQVVGLRPASGEDDVARSRADQGRDRMTGRVEHRASLLSGRVDRRRIAGNVLQNPADGIDHARRGWSGGVVVQIDAHLNGFMVALPLYTAPYVEKR